MESSRRTVLRAAAAGAVGIGVTAGAAEVSAAQGKTGPTIGILLYDRFSILDPTGPAEILSRLPGATVTMIAERRGPVRTDTGDVALLADRSIDEVHRLDVLVVPGGSGKAISQVFERPRVLDWVKRIHERTQWTTSVCTGAFILARIGLLTGLRATTYWSSKPYLEEYGVEYVAERYVRAGKIITAAGVSAGQDMALYLAALMAGEQTAKALQLAVEYDPRPPYDTGSPGKAGPELRELALRLLADSQI
ncbi:DJ-1/PfpI family protein [Kibdelosporangium phytohabitans]|uniref:Thiamine biosynthesis protein ThiJ n=1 Tax=Kibdelosporangium phytohabitans TaxID=860235 RepID=A0A0N9IIP1_9PSEU|nr:DJ-1/PfpI family protein [Kibdelosporangium phytohabitans]ALG14877.1 thiamine biosynthesis protein ThiJ [Kibdelosporangium phytohabitans]MBE1470248.1 transcriptional regulator GlxA family with amidase domain [Kibdelosporangium phytohabitans]